MRKLFVIVGAILCSLVFVMAKGRTSDTPGPSSTTTASMNDGDDHDDSSPVKVGYAVVTPVSTTNGTSTLVAFETFGLRENFGATQAGVLPPSLTTNALLFVDADGRLSKNLGVAIVNPNPSTENVTLTLLDSTGKPLGSTVVQVLSHHQVSKFVTELFANQASVPKNVTGTLSITSTDPVSVIGLRFREANFSTLPITNLAATGTVPVISTGVGGPGSILLPQFAADGGWATEIVLVNSGSGTVTVRVDLFDQAGNPLMTKMNNLPANSTFTNTVIPPNGVFVLAPRNSSGDDDF
jgi:hypothetical protein